MKSYTLHYMNSRMQLSPYISRVEQAVDEVWARASGLVPDVALDIAVEAARDGGIPEIGHCGFAPRSGLIRLILDPDNPNLEQHMGESLERTIAHELHHALRWDAVGYGSTLLDSLVSEGLAGRFAEELYGNSAELWESALKATDISRYAGIALAGAESTCYNHRAWFFGSSEFPRWTGYTLGWELIGNLTGKLAGRMPSELIETKGSEFYDSLKSLAAT